MNIKKFQRRIAELGWIVVGAVSKVSHRRVIESINSIDFVSAFHRTSHGWVMESDCIDIVVSRDIFFLYMANVFDV